MSSILGQLKVNLVRDVLPRTIQRIHGVLAPLVLFEIIPGFAKPVPLDEGTNALWLQAVSAVLHSVVMLHFWPLGRRLTRPRRRVLSSRSLLHIRANQRLCIAPIDGFSQLQKPHLEPIMQPVLCLALVKGDVQVRKLVWCPGNDDVLQGGLHKLVQWMVE